MIDQLAKTAVCLCQVLLDGIPKSTVTINGCKPGQVVVSVDHGWAVQVIQDQTDGALTSSLLDPDGDPVKMLFETPLEAADYLIRTVTQ